MSDLIVLHPSLTSWPGLLADPYNEEACLNSILPLIKLPTENHEIPLDDPNSTAMEDTATSASLDGVANVFSKYMCNAIRKVVVVSEGILAKKAAVTMEFP